MVQWEWQFQTLTNMSAWVGLDRSSMHMANVNDTGAPLATDTPNATLGGPTYPLAARWGAADKERNWSGGASLTPYSGATRYGPRRLDFGWSHQPSRGITRYRFAPPGALPLA